MPKIKYFNLSKWTDSKTHGYIFIAPKGIGKTYAGIKYAFNDWDKNKRGTAWLFNNEKEADAFKIELRSYIDLEKYILKGSKLYDKATNIIFGVILSVKNPFYVKNNQYISNLIFDEFTNSDGTAFSKVYANFVMLLSNLERLKPNFRIFMFSNAITNNNAFFKELNIFIPPTKTEEVNIFYRLDGDLKIIILPETAHAEIAKIETTAKKWARLNMNIYNSYFKNEFSMDDYRMIDMTPSIPKDQFFKQALYKINLENLRIAVFMMNDGIIYFDYAQKYDNHFIFRQTINLLSMDFLMNQDHRSKDERQEAIYLMWERAISCDKILFNTFELKNAILEFLASRRMQYG